MNHTPHGETEGSQAKQFWEEHWRQRGRKQPWSGRANVILARFTESLPVGTALDVGCGTGGNALWLAERGWQIVAVDISDNALEQATSNAATAQVTDRINFQQHDLARTFPTGTFDLVYVMYLQSPLSLPRERILRKAAEAVAPGGLLLIVTHASVAPWSWNQDRSVRFPTPQEALAKLELDLKLWHVAFLGAPERLANGPDGQTATVTDTIIALERLTSWK